MPRPRRKGVQGKGRSEHDPIARYVGPSILEGIVTGICVPCGYETDVMTIERARAELEVHREAEGCS